MTLAIHKKDKHKGESVHGDGEVHRRCENKDEMKEVGCTSNVGLSKKG